MLIIDRLELEFQPGLNVLTGETGAGKSILLDSLGFVLGWRGRAELVRSGAAQGEVTAVFDLPQAHPAHGVLMEAGFEDADELILRRVNTADGRKTGWVNDRRVTGEMLRALSDTLVELHGQHDDRGLLNPKGHRALLDQFAGHDGLLADVRSSWKTLSKARKALAEAGKSPCGRESRGRIPAPRGGRVGQAATAAGVRTPIWMPAAGGCRGPNGFGTISRAPGR